MIEIIKKELIDIPLSELLIKKNREMILYKLLLTQNNNNE